MKNKHAQKSASVLQTFNEDKSKGQKKKKEKNNKKEKNLQEPEQTLLKILGYFSLFLAHLIVYFRSLNKITAGSTILPCPDKKVSTAPHKF